MEMMRAPIYTYVAFDELEYLATGAETGYEVDGELWMGGDFHRAWVKLDGARATAGDLERELEVQTLYSYATSPFWNVQAGIRGDYVGDEHGSEARGHVALGVQGLAPYWFEIEGFLFVSFQGDVSARFEATYETLLTQRLIVESELEVNAAFQEVPAFTLGSGLNDVGLGARMRYEIMREFAPYVGYRWMRSLGDTAALQRGTDGGGSRGAFVVGLHLWY